MKWIDFTNSIETLCKAHTDALSVEITYGKHLPHKNSQLCFSHNQFKIMQLILKNKNESNITSTLNISQQTLKIQKFNIMYKLKLRRMSDIVTLGITSYF